ncbi:hypothetical protein F5884DRAFT_861933 [Xylogone sp. PMI_703]|nr:hypothetical protein F5884DRAFT_861933 [Xylogone sp. PMI_703]
MKFAIAAVLALCSTAMALIGGGTPEDGTCNHQDPQICVTSSGNHPCEPGQECVTSCYWIPGALGYAEGVTQLLT